MAPVANMIGHTKAGAILHEVIHLTSAGKTHDLLRPSDGYDLKILQGYCDGVVDIDFDNFANLEYPVSYSQQSPVAMED